MITFDVPRLLDLAEAMRGPDWRDELQQALLAAKFGGLDQEHAFRYAFRLLLHDGSSPYELTVAARSPFRKDERGDYETGVAAVRAAMTEKLAQLPAPREGL